MNIYRENWKPNYAFMHYYYTCIPTGPFVFILSLFKIGVHFGRYQYVYIFITLNEKRTGKLKNLIMIAVPKLYLLSIVRALTTWGLHRGPPFLSTAPCPKSTPSSLTAMFHLFALYIFLFSDGIHLTATLGISYLSFFWTLPITSMFSFFGQI